MPDQIHALIQTPQPNLATGMQHWLSGYANWYAKRNRRRGHLYQGPYKTFLVEDAPYYWTLSRYIHLNPCRGSSPLAADPESWPYSSFGGCAGFGSEDFLRRMVALAEGSHPQATATRIETAFGLNTEHKA